MRLAYFYLDSIFGFCSFPFFSIEKFAEATRKYAALKSELAAAKDRGGGGDESKKNLLLKRPNNRAGQNQPAMKISDLKLAFSEFYLSLILLQNYQNLNFTGFRKILKKHDKVCHIEFAD